MRKTAMTNPIPAVFPRFLFTISWHYEQAIILCTPKLNQLFGSNRQGNHMTSAPNCPNEIRAGLLAPNVPMQLALGSDLVVDTSATFRLGHRHYLARPSGFKRHRANISGVGENDEASLATCFRLEENQTINADCLRAWRADHLDHDDAFHPSFLQEVIFGGADDVHLESDTRDLFGAWGTVHVSFAPYLKIPNGPYYVKNDSIHSIWRVYEDRQLAFVQAIWPSIESEG